MTDSGSDAVPRRSMPAEIRFCGDTAISVVFGDSIDSDISDRVMELDAALQEARIPGIVETVPTYCTLMIHIDPALLHLQSLRERICEMTRTFAGKRKSGRCWQVPVAYGGRHGVDLDSVAEHCRLTPDAVIKLHSEAVYTVSMIGFLPGFSYLSGLADRLAVPRRCEPRLSIPPSSIAIGGAQTAIGSVEGPSGWHLIGRTPVRPFMPGRQPVFLFEPGDEIRFSPILDHEWQEFVQAAARGSPVAVEMAQ